MAEEPAFYTVEEAASIWRIGRTTAYKLAAVYEATGGSEGLPVERIGHVLRVPRAKLEERAGGPVRRPMPDGVIDPRDRRADEPRSA